MKIRIFCPPKPMCSLVKELNYKTGLHGTTLKNNFRHYGL